MQQVYKLFLLVIVALTVITCKKENTNYQTDASSPEALHQSMEMLSHVLIHDIFSPPVASRNYVYPSIAAYEVARHMDPNYSTFSGKITHLKAIPQPSKDLTYCYPIAATEAFLTTAKKFIFSEDSVTLLMDKMHKQWAELGIPKDVYDRSLAYGQTVAQHVIAWSKEDNYSQTRSYPKYDVSDEAYSWKPTPPAYMESIEPHWNKIRPMALSTADEFKPVPPTPFSKDKSSQFYKEMMEVYNIALNATDEQKAIANFWDCNPYKLNVIGHAMHATKKITPGGHWIGIAKIASKKSNADYVKSAYAYAATSIALFDGFVSCWDEKYRSKLIRPETIINEIHDDSWVPLLQTPPFPEYTSGHSVISSAASEVLTAIYGDGFAFDDTSELEFGLPVRKFASFKAASEEAAISRLYGGIHYRPAIVNGVEQGNKIGKYLIAKLSINKPKD